MSANLWSANHPRHFWQTVPDLPEELWQAAIAEALPALGLTSAARDVDSILALTLGEARFGPDHWRLSLPKRVYYLVKPLLPRPLTRLMRRLYRRAEAPDPDLQWPVEPRYAAFLWNVLAQVLRALPDQRLFIKPLWPNASRFALVLTHDVETAHGQAFVRAVADLEESLGFRSSFNFVPERYRVDMALLDDLRRRGFEIGLHGLKHDGKLFHSRRIFDQRAARINRHLKQWGSAGFRAPLTHRNPEWMQALDIEYDLSFFDTDPFEPIPGGVMSLWPFFLGHFVELPYTLVQDYTLTAVLSETTPRLWLEKVDFIAAQHGMALINSHPDYLKEPASLRIYADFLSAMRSRTDHWPALPRTAADWWKRRASDDFVATTLQLVSLEAGRPVLMTASVSQAENALML